MKYVGFTLSDPKLIESEWHQQGKIVANFTVVHSGLTFDQAVDIEFKYRTRGYLAEAIGPIVLSSPIYSLYTFEY